MGKIIDAFKAILTRIIFSAHGFIAIWRVTTSKGDPNFWYLSVSLLVLLFEGIFTLTIKANQEWRWFCPSVFLYLSSVVPSIWLLEFDKLDKRWELREEVVEVLTTNSSEELSAIQTFGVEIKIPVALTAEAWTTIIGQFLMLILIIGRWLLPKGDLTREQLSQLLLVYIGTAADIIEFFDSFKDDKIAANRILCIIILSIWSWSLLQFTLVITSPSKPKTKRGKIIEPKKQNTCTAVCCNVDVWSILINIILQDAPFFIFRLLLICYYNIISYMNIFFTCKNTLVIILQFYRLIVIQTDKRKEIMRTAKGEKVIIKKGTKKEPEKGKRSSSKGSEKGVKLERRDKPQKRLMMQLSEEEFASPALSSSRLVDKDNQQWKGRGRRKSLSTGNLHEMVEFYYEDEMTSNERTSCLISSDFEPDEDPEYEDPDKFKQRVRQMRRNKRNATPPDDDFEEEDEAVLEEDLLLEEDDEDQEEQDEDEREWARLNAKRQGLKNARPTPAPRQLAQVSPRTRNSSSSLANGPAPSQRPPKVPPMRGVRTQVDVKGKRPSSRNSDPGGPGSSRAPRQDTGYSSASSQQSHKSKSVRSPGQRRPAEVAAVEFHSDEEGQEEESAESRGGRGSKASPVKPMNRRPMREGRSKQTKGTMTFKSNLTPSEMAVIRARGRFLDEAA